MEASKDTRRTVDYYNLLEPLENAQKDMGFKTFSEFARQIARDWLHRNYTKKGTDGNE